MLTDERLSPLPAEAGQDHNPDVLPLEEGIRRFEDGPGEADEGTRKREWQVETAGGGAGVGQTDIKGYCGGKLLSPERRRCAVEHAREEYAVSERRACRVVRQWRGTQRYLPLRRTDEDQLTQAILALAGKYGRYGWYSFKCAQLSIFRGSNCDSLLRTVALHWENHLIAQSTAALATIFVCVECKNLKQVCHSSGFYFRIHFSCSNLPETTSGLPRLSKGIVFFKDRVSAMRALVRLFGKRN
jgi:hypothetical protein